MHSIRHTRHTRTRTRTTRPPYFHCPYNQCPVWGLKTISLKWNLYRGNLYLYIFWYYVNRIFGTVTTGTINQVNICSKISARKKNNIILLRSFNWRWGAEGSDWIYRIDGFSFHRAPSYLRVAISHTYCFVERYKSSGLLNSILGHLSWNSFIPLLRLLIRVGCNNTSINAMVGYSPKHAVTQCIRIIYDSEHCYSVCSNPSHSLVTTHRHISFAHCFIPPPPSMSLHWLWVTVMRLRQRTNIWTHQYTNIKTHIHM